ncbi:MAG: ATP cone domain-containing protein [Spirochaetota bacterium]
MITHIVKRDGRVVPFDPEKITFAVLRAAVAVGGRDRETAERITREVVERLDARHGTAAEHADDYPTVEEVQDAVEKVLIERGHARTAKAYIVYRYEHALKRAGRESLTYSSENIPYRKLWEALSWAVDHRCHTLAGIRDYVESGRYHELVRISEEFYAREIASAGELLSDRIDDVRVMIIAGPSSSGKTTTTIKVAEAIPDRRLVPINVDNYFYDLETHPKDAHGDYDFETPQALDIELLNDHLRRLISGETVDIPYYNFRTGNREGVSETVKLGPKDIVLIDSLHGFYDAMTESVPDEQKFKLYIETLAQVKDDENRFVRWTDVRMLRRMVRDMQFRNYNPEQTLRHWYLVRRAELRYIVSRLKKAEVIVNSFMPSELPIMKGRLESRFPEFVDHLEGDEEKRDARERAERIIELFAQVPAVPTEDAIPGDSLLREFIGGSTYDYH